MWNIKDHDVTADSVNIILSMDIYTCFKYTAGRLEFKHRMLGRENS